MLEIQHASVKVPQPQALDLVRGNRLCRGLDVEVCTDETVLRQSIGTTGTGVLAPVALEQKHAPSCVAQLAADGQVPTEAVLLLRLQREARGPLGEPRQREDPAAGEAQRVEAREAPELARARGAAAHTHADEVGRCPASLLGAQDAVHVPVACQVRCRGASHRCGPLAQRLCHPHNLDPEPLIDDLLQFHGIDDALGALQARVDLQGLLEAIQGLPALSCGLVAHAHACETTKVTWLQAEHFSAVRKGALEVLQQEMRSGPLVPALREGGGALNHLGEQPYCSLKFLFLHQR
mmetsp:Transcript_3813/g.10591  ORF Transcript_3813/g.10591 Transcript_3813/m.10591 type:complete len:293 (-) Transcript_3813:264-1142(-)